VFKNYTEVGKVFHLLWLCEDSFAVNCRLQLVALHWTQHGTSRHQKNRLLEVFRCVLSMTSCKYYTVSKTDSCFIFKYLQQIWSNVNNLWCRIFY